MNHKTATPDKSQTTDTLLMVRPTHFGYNQQTAGNNAFQTADTGEDSHAIRQQAQAEFDGFVQRLREAGVEVIVVEDNDGVIRPDAVFPNNWVTFHHNGTVITYPMYAPNRRLERRDDVIEMLREQFEVRRVVRFEGYENTEQFLEGTGSMILDRMHRVMYACLSPRTDAKLLEEFSQWANYEKVEFHAVDDGGTDIYHTNVMMALGDRFVVICLDCVPDPTERKRLETMFRKTGKDVIAISMEQMLHSFAGNMLQVQNRDGQTFLVMSERAYRSLNEPQKELILAHTQILYAPLDTIEKYGGGSARCMMAEVFLPRK